MKQTDLSLIFTKIIEHEYTRDPPQYRLSVTVLTITPAQSMVEKKKEKLCTPVNSSFTIIEPHQEKTGLRGFRPGPK